MKFTKKYDSILTKEYLQQKYVVERLGPYKIANEVGCTPHTIYKYLKTHQIKQEVRNISVREKETYNLLTTIKIIDKRKNGCNIWLCKCSCGNLTKVDSGQLNNGNVKSCGCNKRRKGIDNPNWKGFENISGNLFQSIRGCARNRRIEFNVSIEEINDLFQQQNGTCALSGLDIHLIPHKETASLDRVDSSKAYTVDNIQWLHKDVNKIKSDLSISQFYYYCQLVSNPLIPNIKLQTNIIYCSFWKNILYNANKRNKDFTISKEDAIEIYNNQNGICYITGIPITLPLNFKEFRNKTFTASLDRINNAEGYYLSNIKWCHKDINQSRKDLDINYYKYLCNLVTNKRKETI